MLAQKSPQSIVYWFKIEYAFEFFYMLGMGTVKVSIILFLWRIFPIRQFRMVLKGALVFVLSLTGSCLLVSMLQCIPIHDFWDTYAGRLHGGRCINVTTYFMVVGGINTFTDFALLALPIPLLWRLKTGLLQKLVLTGVFTMGLM